MENPKKDWKREDITPGMSIQGDENVFLVLQQSDTAHPTRNLCLATLSNGLIIYVVRGYLATKEELANYFNEHKTGYIPVEKEIKNEQRIIPGENKETT